MTKNISVTLDVEDLRPSDQFEDRSKLMTEKVLDLFSEMNFKENEVKFSAWMGLSYFHLSMLLSSLFWYFVFYAQLIVYVYKTI